MPTRLIREGWLESEAINLLDASTERFYLRLLLRADDYGRYHANTTLLKSNLFPLRDDVRSADITRWLAACEKAGLIRCYSASDKAYLEIPKFGQRARADQSKFPAPPAEPSAALLPGMALSEATPKRPACARHAPGIRPASDGPPRTYAETKSKQIQAPAASPPAQVSEPSALPQSLAVACGIQIAELGPRARSGFDAALREISAAAPTVTPEEIAARAVAYRKIMPAGCRLTPHALGKHWAACGPAKAAAPEPVVAPPPHWRITLEKLYPGNVINSQERDWSTVPEDIRTKIINEGVAA